MTSQGVPHPELNGYQQIIVWCARGAKGLGVFVPRPANGTQGSGEGLDHPWTTPPCLKVKFLGRPNGAQDRFDRLREGLLVGARFDPQKPACAFLAKGAP